MMNLFAGQMVKQNDILPGYEELAFAEGSCFLIWKNNRNLLSTRRA